MRTAQLTREWSFDAAHRITNHPGKCRSLHGHTFHAKVTIEGRVNDETGMVMDFACFKEIGDKLFDDAWDHAALLNDRDPLVEPVKEIESRMYLFFGNEPTAENLAFIAVRHFRGELPLSVNLVSVEIAETPKCSANCVVTANLPKPQHKPL